MNRYPLWKYIVILVSLVRHLVHTSKLLGNPQHYKSTAKATVKVDSDLIPRVEAVLKEAGINSTGSNFDFSGILQSVIVPVLQIQILSSKPRLSWNRGQQQRPD